MFWRSCTVLLLEVTILLILMSHLYRRKPRTSINIMLHTVTVAWLFLYYWSKRGCRMLIEAKKKKKKEEKEKDEEGEFLRVCKVIFPPRWSHCSRQFRMIWSVCNYKMKHIEKSQKSYISHWPMKINGTSLQKQQQNYLWNQMPALIWPKVRCAFVFPNLNNLQRIPTKSVIT